MTLKKVPGLIYSVLCVLSVFGVLETLVVRGLLYDVPRNFQVIVLTGYTAIVALYIVWTAMRLIVSGWKLRPLVPDIFLSLLLISTVIPVVVGGSIVSFRIVIRMFGTFFRSVGITAFLAQIRFNPARVLLLSFIGVIIIGTVLLMLPAATNDRQGTVFIDALFTSTSATCVTGLIVRDTGSYFSGFGKTVIALLMQIGGLGIMTLSTLFAMILGRRLGYREEEQIRGILDQTSSMEMYRLITRIFTITFTLESIGALLLYVKWFSPMGSDKALFSAAFHSISAFCNAGFCLYRDSLSAYSGDWFVNMVFMVLIVSGGLGFVVLNDILEHSRRNNPFAIEFSRLSVHSKLVIITTAALIVTGTMAVFFFEFDNTMLGLSSIDKLLAAAFQSVTFRTAGFNTIDISGMRDVTLMIGILFMFIGASPSSTGGGIKTTTFAILLVSVRSLLRSRDQVEIFGRTIRHQTVYKSVAILLFSSTFLIIFTILLLSTQTGMFIDILFEAVSALGTVGLSTGVTGTLDSVGKILITALMYIGRVGPLTVALALGEVKKVNLRFPTARVTVG